MKNEKKTKMQKNKNKNQVYYQQSWHLKAYLQIDNVILDNNLDFNLCIVSTVCWMVVILDYKILEKSKILEDSQLDLCQILVRRVRDNIRVVNFF